jgi:hypothetical protein
MAVYGSVCHPLNIIDLCTITFYWTTIPKLLTDSENKDLSVGYLRWKWTDTGV